jgi:hypothetical protein
VSSNCGKDLGVITEGGGLAIHFRGEAHSFVCFTDMVENGAEKCSETALSFAVDDVATLTFVHKTRGQTDGL